MATNTLQQLDLTHIAVTMRQQIECPECGSTQDAYELFNAAEGHIGTSAVLGYGTEECEACEAPIPVIWPSFEVYAEADDE